MSSIIHLEFIKNHSGSSAKPPHSNHGQAESEETIRRSYTPALFQHVVGELEGLVKKQHARIRLDIDQTPDVAYTMQFIRSNSSLLYNHLMETIPPKAIKSSLVEQHDVSIMNVPLHIRIRRYLKLNPLIGFLLPVLFIGIVYALFPAFSKKAFQKISSSRERIYERASLPFQSGWIMLGHYSENRQRYTDGPYAMILKSSSGEKSSIIQAGDVIVITKPRKVIIVDYQQDGIGQVLEQPWLSGPVSSNDYTGVEIKAGQKVQVLEVALSADYLRELWARVADLDE